MPEIEDQTTAEAVPVDAEPTRSVDELPSLADAFAANAQQTDAEADTQDDDSEDDTDEDDPPQADDDAPAKSDPDESGEKPKPLTANERRRQRIEAAEADATKAKANLEALQGDLTAKQVAAFQSLGDDARFQALHAKAEAARTLGQEPEYWMDADEHAEYTALHSKREHAFAFKTMADAASIAEVRSGFADEAKALGIDALKLPDGTNARAFAQVALRAAVSATETRVKADWADEKARLEADNQSMTTKLASRSTPIGRGGRSDSTVRTKDTPDWDTASPSDFFAAAARSQNGAKH